MSVARPIPAPLVELVARRLRVLGQPVRVRLVDRLERLGETHVQALADELAATQQNTSKPLGALWRAGVVSRRQDGRLTLYGLADPEAFVVVETVTTAIAIQLRGMGDDLSPGQPAR